MNMLKYKSLIEEGDLVIVYLDVRHLYPITVKRDEVFQSKYELKPGSIVCEAGTGSGSLSHALAKAIAPSGVLHTFDFHVQRVEVAQQEFNSHGLGNLVKVLHRDVCSDGFGIEQEADAVFLDLPNPWEAVEHAVKALKPKAGGSRICSFSPCIEQVQQTCKALQDFNFQDIITVECLQRVYDVKKITQSIISFEGPKSGEKMTDSEPGADDAAMGDTHEPQPGTKRTSRSNDCETITRWTAVPPLQTAGHTGYLTYASLCSS